MTWNRLASPEGLRTVANRSKAQPSQPILKSITAQASNNVRDSTEPAQIEEVRLENLSQILHSARKKRGTKHDLAPTKATKVQRAHCMQIATLQSSTQSRTQRPIQPPERHAPSPANAAAGEGSLQHRTQSEPAQTRGQCTNSLNIFASKSAEKLRNT